MAMAVVEQFEQIATLFGVELGQPPVVVALSKTLTPGSLVSK
jgi:hypothetical protein